MKRKGDMHNHLKKLIEDLRAGKVDSKPGVHYVEVLHDDDCFYLNGKGVCNCDVEINGGMKH